MIERLFDLVKSPAARRIPAPAGGPRLGMARKSCPESTKQTAPARRLHGHMKRASPRLVTATLRTGFLVVVALILILVLLPAAIAAQAAGLR
jgi:hypothetical protein